MTDSRVAILDVPLTAQRFDDAIERLIAAARDDEKLRAHFCTVHSVVEAQTNPSLMAAFRSAAMLAMDGVPLVWVARFRGRKHAERVCGPDVLLALCDRGRGAGLRHYFFGGKPGVPEDLAARLAERYPGLEVVGTESPPFGPVSETEEAAQLARINAVRPHVLWVGLGSPKQELWAADHEGQLAVPVILPVGAAFDFYSGRLRRAPRWMQRLGLEWLFRLAAEPRRLFRRYVVTNSLFLYLVAREGLRQRR